MNTDESIVVGPRSGSATGSRPKSPSRAPSPNTGLTHQMGSISFPDYLFPYYLFTDDAYMRDSTACRELAHLPVLSVDNWNEWRWKFRIVLDAGGTGDYFFEKATDSRGVTRRRRRSDCESKEAKELWDTNATLTCFWLRKAVGMHFYSIIERFIDDNDPQSAYDALVATFEYYLSSDPLQTFPTL
ncbi:hypothetical protein M408DRAFT_7818 [Serendipita vermifera MAFF 305830]|uniref:Uncharacterized protein n=1 Tax=Serendipita vermifera MAFF 305830 TaxID=933852 RepID=A0A0C2XMZ7_SERVB|nr:hypothetical protein M408DRAFT_7818 [Serendipita vermifera MAFF 305830]